MKDPRQIKIVIDFLTREKNKYLKELAKVQMMINKKSSSLDKINTYRQEYNKKDYLILSQTVPSLCRNLDNFLNELNAMMEKDTGELHKLNGIKNSIVNKSEKIEKQLAYIISCQKTLQINIIRAIEKEEQNIMDELISQQGRINYD